MVFEREAESETVMNGLAALANVVPGNSENKTFFLALEGMENLSNLLQKDIDYFLNGILLMFSDTSSFLDSRSLNDF